MTDESKPEDAETQEAALKPQSRYPWWASRYTAMALSRFLIAYTLVVASMLFAFMGPVEDSQGATFLYTVTAGAIGFYYKGRQDE